MERQPKISVIIPVCNAEKYVRECLESIIKQSLRAIEIICVDDGSKDGTLSILKEYEKKDSRIIVLCQKNQGAGIARNLGLKHATGEYVHFLDADDYLAENAYEIMYMNAANFGVDMVKTKVYGIDAQSGKMVENIRYDMTFVHKKYFNRVVTFDEIPEIFVRNVAVVPWNGIYRREFLMENGITFNSLICVNDRSFYSHVIIKAQKMLLLPQRTVYHRTNMDTSLVGRRCRHFECHFKSYRIIEALCEDMAEKQKAIILSGELNDIFSWYELYKGNEEYGAGITKLMCDFLKDLDITFFRRYRARMPWEQKLIMLSKGCDCHCVKYKLVEKLVYIPNKLKMVAWCIKDAGVSSVLRRIGTKINLG